MRHRDKKVSKMSVTELRQHVMELRHQNDVVFTQLRLALANAHKWRKRSYRLGWLCGCVALVLIVGLVWHWYYK